MYGTDMLELGNNFLGTTLAQRDVHVRVRKGHTCVSGFDVLAYCHVEKFWNRAQNAGFSERLEGRDSLVNWKRTDILANLITRLAIS